MRDPLPPPVRALLRDRIASFEQLEVLFLLHRDRDRAWTSHAVAKELSIASAMAAEDLDQLCRANLVDVRVGGALSFRFSPGTPELEDAVAKLHRAFLDRPMDVARAMSEHAVERGRTSAMRTFADAFVLRKRGKSRG